MSPYLPDLPPDVVADLEALTAIVPHLWRLSMPGRAYLVDRIRRMPEMTTSISTGPTPRTEGSEP